MFFLGITPFSVSWRNSWYFPCIVDFWTFNYLQKWYLVIALSLGAKCHMEDILWVYQILRTYFTSLVVRVYISNTWQTSKVFVNIAQCRRAITGLSLALIYLTFSRRKLFIKNKHASKNQGYQNRQRVNNKIYLNIQGNELLYPPRTITKTTICKLFC